MNEKGIVVSGKRKRSVAKARIKEGSGNILINGSSYKSLNYLRRLMIEEPIKIAEKQVPVNFDITVKINGGGKESQIEAARLAIARAILAFTKNEQLKRDFLNYDRNMVVADIRRKEARKPGDSKARAKRQKSYR